MKPAFLFPGQGSQFVGMGRDLYDNHPAARLIFFEADAALGFPLTKLIFEGPEDQLKLTEYTQPAILTVSIAATRALAEEGIFPAFAAGHSLGEYSAHVAAGTLKFADAVRTVRNRGRYMQEAVPAGKGAMAAILALSAEHIIGICVKAAAETGEIVSAANLNSPDQTVISGTVTAVERAAELCKEIGAKRTVMLPVSAPFHCALMQPAQDALAKDLAELAFNNPTCPIAANVDAHLVMTATDSRDRLIRQVTGSVRWVECIQLLATQGIGHFVEVGPGKVLSGLNRQILGKDSTIPTVNVEDTASLEKTLVSLASQSQ
jgi:[acyl-carrier-protein] S-malonyltransferase